MPMDREPDLNDPSIYWVDRALKALQEEFKDDKQIPRFVMVAECPPDGRIGVGSTADDEIDTHRILTLAAASVVTAMDEDTKAVARAFWDQAEADFRSGRTPRRT